MAYSPLHMIIDGEKITVGSRRTHAVVNPASGQALGDLPLADAADLDHALDAAKRGFAIWREAPPAQRAAVLTGAAALLRARAEAIATICTTEQGKPLAESRAEVEMVANLFTFYAGECSRIYGRILPRAGGARASVTYEPVGPVAAFAPWNFPLGNVGRKLGAPIAAGCSVVMKPAEETPGSAIAIVEALLEAGLPKEVVGLVFGVPDEVSRHLLASPIIRKLSFTGSTVVGKHLAKLAAEDMKRTTMELGGHGPVLVFADADIDRAIATAAAAKARNAGQVCISPTRFIVEESVFSQFRDGVAERLGALTVGNGLDAATQMGPMANPRRPEAIEAMIAGAVVAGGRLNTGGKRIGNEGFFYAPSVVSEVPQGARIMNEEPFGPVAIINPFRDEAAMVAEANRLPYGLAGYLWSSDGKRIQRVAREIEVGMVSVNGAVVASADAPFGGVKWSGHGHEDGPEGVMACMVTKAIHEA